MKRCGSSSVKPSIVGAGMPAMPPTPPVMLDAGTAEKLPLKKAAGMEVDSDVACCTSRKPSYDAMKNVLSRPLYSFGIITGPSNSTPN